MPTAKPLVEKRRLYAVLFITGHQRLEFWQADAPCGILLQIYLFVFCH
ncbi:hypothetical protein [Komarekiella delphini-convector]|nr:hypothetical protein [Komarekiella delphini-convector]